MRKAPGHPDRQLVFNANGMIELHVIDEEGGMWGFLDLDRAQILAHSGVPVAVLGNGLLAISYPGCTLARPKCRCVRVSEAIR